MLTKQHPSRLRPNNNKQLALSSAKPCVRSLCRKHLAVPFRAWLASLQGAPAEHGGEAGKQFLC